MLRIRPKPPAHTKTLRNAQVRRISWVRGVRPAGERHRVASSNRSPPATYFARLPLRKTKGAARRPFSFRTGPASAGARLLDLLLGELDVLARDRIVLLLLHLLGHRPR